jgi:hypothetical protein
VTAVVVSIHDSHYHYDNGVYYTASSGGYTVVNPPTNIVVNTLPEGVEKITLNDVPYYYFGGAFYEASGDSYRVIDAPGGAVITNIPEGATEEDIEGTKYVVYNYTYFLPITQNGKDLYQVVTMEAYDPETDPETTTE